MSFYYLRRRLDALKRQLTVPLAVVRLRPVAEAFCDQWALAAFQGGELPPVTHSDTQEPRIVPSRPDIVSSVVSSNEALPFGNPEATGISGDAVDHALTLAGARKTGNRPLVRRVVDAGFRLHTFTALVWYADRCRNDRVLPHPDEILRILLPKAAVCGLIPRSSSPIAY